MAMASPKALDLWAMAEPQLPQNIRVTAWIGQHRRQDAGDEDEEERGRRTSVARDGRRVILLDRSLELLSQRSADAPSRAEQATAILDIP